MTVSCYRQGITPMLPVAASGVLALGCVDGRPRTIVDRRECRVEGYLQRKLHRQWRNRGS